MAAFFFCQLLHSMQNYKDRVRDLYNENYSEPKKVFIFKDNEIIRKSIQYPAYILRYLFGGYVICFHFLLFLMIVVRTIIIHRRKRVTRHPQD